MRTKIGFQRILVIAGLLLTAGCLDGDGRPVELEEGALVNIAPRVKMIPCAEREASFTVERAVPFVAYGAEIVSVTPGATARLLRVGGAEWNGDPEDLDRFIVVVQIQDADLLRAEAQIRVAATIGFDDPRESIETVTVIRDCSPPAPPSRPGVEVQASCMAKPEDARLFPEGLRHLGKERPLTLAGEFGVCFLGEDGQSSGSIEGSSPFGSVWVRSGGSMQMSSGLQAAPQAAAERWYLVLFGPGGLAITEYLPDVEDFGAVLLDMFRLTFTDAIENDRENPTFLTITSISAQLVIFLTTDASGNLSYRPETVQFAVTDPRPVSAIRRFLDGGVAIATDAGTLLYSADPSQPDAPQVVGTFFADPRRLRAAGGLLFGSDFGGSKIAVFRWDGRSVPVFLRDVEVGDSPIGIDARLRADGTIAVVGTGFHDHTYWVAILDAQGDLQSLTKTDLPEGCLNPGHVTWLGDNEFVVTCNGSDQIVRVTLASE